MKMIKNLFLKKKQEVQNQELAQQTEKADLEKRKNKYLDDLENSEYIPDNRNNYGNMYDFNPEGEYIQTEQGIAIATITRDESTK